MKVKELIEQLQKEDPEKDVLVPHIDSDIYGAVGKAKYILWYAGDIVLLCNGEEEYLEIQDERRCQ